MAHESGRHDADESATDRARIDYLAGESGCRARRRRSGRAGRAARAARRSDAVVRTARRTGGFGGGADRGRGPGHRRNSRCTATTPGRDRERCHRRAPNAPSTWRPPARSGNAERALAGSPDRSSWSPPRQRLSPSPFPRRWSCGTPPASARSTSRCPPPNSRPAPPAAPRCSRRTPAGRSSWTQRVCPGWTAGEFYQAWLRNADGVLVPIGTFNEGTDVTLWAGVPPDQFSTMTITRESADGDQDSSGQRVLVGTAVEEGK